ncbi:MAG TPA: hypothetical protein VFW09_19910 [Solirubrobacteraceae bacterium]|nr:hypothetical protein [Solirubrobacteraceae bacterium]
MLRELAEYPNSFIELGPGAERIETDRYTLCLHPRGATVQRQRFAAHELDAVVEQVRARLRERGRTRTQWEIGSQATPPGLAQTLEARGFVRDDEPWALALALTKPPLVMDTVEELRVAQVVTAEDYVEARGVQDAGFGAAEEELQAGRERHAREFEALDRSRGGRAWSQMPNVLHAVWIGERIVCAGMCERTRLGLTLFGGATLPEFRGRGAYRALIAERWRLAVADAPQRPALVTQAGAMSRPILAALGFEAIGRVEMLVDDFEPRDDI